MHNNVLHT